MYNIELMGWSSFSFIPIWKAQPNNGQAAVAADLGEGNLYLIFFFLMPLDFLKAQRTLCYFLKRLLFTPCLNEWLSESARKIRFWIVDRWPEGSEEREEPFARTHSYAVLLGA